jgi:hypothetical protein
MIREKNNVMYTHLANRRNDQYISMIVRASRPGCCVETTNLRERV